MDTKATKMGTTQTVVIAGMVIGAAYYSYHTKKSLLMGALITILSGTAGYFVGGYVETMTKK